MGLPGVKVGPMDPDRTADFGQVGKGNTARQLIRIHAQQHPPELRQALARKLDPERTKGLLMDEVRGYLADLELENGDPAIPKGAVVEGAQVRGERDSEQVLTYTYRTKSGRSVKWFAPYDADDLPTSVESGDELVKVAEMKERGVVAWDTDGASNDILRRENAGLRRQVGALRDQVESGTGSDGGEDVPGDTRADEQIVADNEQLRRENEEIKQRLADLEAAVSANAQGELHGPEPETDVAAEEPPFEGYDDLTAKDLADRIKSDETSDEERQAILDYESAHKDRRSVVGAANQALAHD